MSEELRHLNTFIHRILFFIISSFITKQIFIRIHYRFPNFDLLCLLKLLFMRILSSSIDASFRWDLISNNLNFTPIDNLEKLVFSLSGKMELASNRIFCRWCYGLFYRHLTFAEYSFFCSNTADTFTSKLMTKVWW